MTTRNDWWLDASPEEIREELMRTRRPQVKAQDHVHQYGPVSDLCIRCGKERPFEWAELRVDPAETVILAVLVVVLLYLFITQVVTRLI